MNSFPKQIPIFPLSGVIYFPKTNLPLNIFEQRYLDLVNDSFKKDKFMGMIQAKRIDQEVYKVGCLGKISDLQKSNDGRILINLTGITRFEILEEKVNKIMNYASRNTRVLVNVSIDGLEELHDKIRRVPGIFKKCLDTIERLKKIKKKYQNLQISALTTLSKDNFFQFKRKL